MCLALLVPSPGSGAEPASGAAPETVERGEVRVGGNTVFVLRAADPGGLSSAERAEITNRRLEKALADPKVGPENIRAEMRGQVPTVMAGPVAVLAVNAVDAGLEDSTPAVLAEHWAAMLRSRFTEAKAHHFSIRLLMSYLQAMTYPILFVLALTGLAKGRRVGLAAIYRVSEDLPSPARLGGVELVSTRALLLALRAALHSTVTAGVLISSYLFLLATFYHFPATRLLGLRMLGGLSFALETIVLTAAEQLGWIAMLCLVAAAAYLAVKVLDRLFDAVADGKISFPPYVTPENADMMENLAQGAVYLLALSVGVLLLPGEGGRLWLGVLAFLGLSVALSSVPILSQLLAGLTLAFLNSHRVGGRLLWEGREAAILRRRMFHTVVLLDDGRRCLLPNHAALASPVVPAEGAPEGQAFELRLAPESGDPAGLGAELQGWARDAGGRAVLLGLDAGTLRYRLIVPAAEEGFLGAACGALSVLAQRRGARLLDLRPLR